MLNEEKVRYMTQLAIFEKRVGKKIFPINRYFKKDYVGGQMFRSFFGYTFCYLLFLLMWVLYKLDELLNEMSIDEILDAAKKWGVIYAAGLVLYLIVTWIVYSKRYDYAARFIKGIRIDWDSELYYERYGGRSLHEQSHGESFLSLMQNTFEEILEE